MQKHVYVQSCQVSSHLGKEQRFYKGTFVGLTARHLRFCFSSGFYDNFNITLTLSRSYNFKFFKGCLPQISLGPFLDTLSQKKVF